MYNQSMEFITKNVNVFKLELDHFREKCSWALLKPGGPEEISNSESPHVFDCQSQEGIEAETSLYTCFISYTFILGACYWNYTVGLLTWCITVILIIYVLLICDTVQLLCTDSSDNELIQIHKG